MRDDDSNLPAIAKRPSAVKRRRDERARKRVRVLRRGAPWLEERRYSVLLSRYAGLTVIFDRLVEDVRQHGITNDLGEPRPILDSIRRLAGTLLNHESALKITPLAGTQSHRPRDMFEALMEDSEQVDAEVSKPDKSAAVESSPADGATTDGEEKRE
jgi:hypothetical protein